jgi:hypothetical protein
MANLELNGLNGNLQLHQDESSMMENGKCFPQQRGGELAACTEDYHYAVLAFQSSCDKCDAGRAFYRIYIGRVYTYGQPITAHDKTIVLVTKIMFAYGAGSRYRKHGKGEAARRGRRLWWRCKSHHRRCSKWDLRARFVPLTEESWQVF